MGIAIPEQFGGQGMTYVDLAVLLEEMGRALVPGPFFATVCLAAPVVLEAGTDAQKQDILPGIASGERNATLAYTESARSDASSIELSAKEEGDGFTLSGTKRFVLDAHVADTLIVAARTIRLERSDAGCDPVRRRRQGNWDRSHAAQCDGHDAAAVRCVLRRRESREGRRPRPPGQRLAPARASDCSKPRACCAPNPSAVRRRFWTCRWSTRESGSSSDVPSARSRR